MKEYLLTKWNSLNKNAKLFIVIVCGMAVYALIDKIF